MSKMCIQQSLEERIAASFADGVTSVEVAALIHEADLAAVVSAEAAESARKQALDPARSFADAAKARRDMDAAAFTRDRMQEAVRRLGERLREVRAQEEQHRRQSAYDEAMVERDKLAAEFKAIYPQIAVQLLDIVARIESNDRTIAYINANVLPVGAERLLSAELVARGLLGFVENSVSVPQITNSLRPPAFERCPHQPFAWPR